MLRKRMKKRLAAVMAIMPLFVVVGCDRAEPVMIEGADLCFEDVEVETTVPEERYVFVCGAVASPGVYEIKDNMRICDAVEAAGGFEQDADTDWLNLAERVEDGQRIYIYTKEETAELLNNPEMSGGFDNRDVGSNGDQAGDNSKININTADRDTLMLLPGIGEARADAIISYRSSQGAFREIEDIKNISGIKGSVFDKICDRITV